MPAAQWFMQACLSQNNGSATFMDAVTCARHYAAEIARGPRVLRTARNMRASNKISGRLQLAARLPARHLQYGALSIICKASVDDADPTAGGSAVGDERSCQLAEPTSQMHTSCLQHA